MAQDKPLPIDPEIVRHALDAYLIDDPNFPQIVSAGVAATIASPYVYPQWLREAGQNPRSARRNELLGHYITVPAPGILAAGICYIDHADDQDDQDMRLLDTVRNTVEAISPTSFARRYPNFGEYHRSAQREFFEGVRRRSSHSDDEMTTSSVESYHATERVGRGSGEH